MKFLPIFLSLLATAALTVASPIGEDDPLGLDAFLAALGVVVDSLTGTPPAPAQPAPPPTTPILDGPARCAVIGTEDVWSESCPGGPSCKKDVKKYSPGDFIEFKCYLAGDDSPKRAWIRIQTPWSYFPRDSLDQDCAKKITEVCPEGTDLPASK